MSGRGRFNTRSSSNQGYNQKQTYNTRNSYSSPAYSTPQGGYQKDQQQQQQHHTPTHQQYHQEQQHVVPAQQQQQHVTPQPQKPEPPPVQVATPKVQPPVQTPQATPKPEDNVQVDADVKMGDEEEDGKKKIGKAWFKRRVSGTPNDFKVPKRIRKRRMNARLKNLLAPKNAMMVLHELHPELKMSVTEQQLNAANQTSYSVEIEIDGQTFKGQGMSKMAAKQAGSEAALKAVLLKKLEENNVKMSAQNATSKVEGGWEEDVSMTDVSDTKADPAEGGEQNGAAAKPKNPQPPEDDVPWGSLASFALYKLFSEWQSQGFQLPVVSGPQLQNVVSPKIFGQPAASQVPTPMKKIPEDAHTKHPVQLLNQIRPGSQYIESREGAPPNLTFTFSVVVDDLTFKGVGSSKKDAKKQCARHALEHLGVVYTD